MKLAAIIFLTLSILCTLFGLKLQKAADQEKRYYQAQQDAERLISPQSASPEIKKAWADLRISDKELNVQRGLGRGVAWIATSLSVLSFIFILLIKKAPRQTT
ncbi:hypothetical protein CMV30_10695 [Nibricoccus aquaticus]|uniref:Uncharacterized protein n=1 Tax=Nibricoccus aquaticus TaxID=2576891 RepID=A0A290QDQ9_9BACT|nr:hypothetical protein [Nibricoccus aquaticus]ATC64386.1 hypothetical protein CMV30_10695 [Nibricoccus aquaticus]